ncbi:MAG: hypothetical protein EP330_19340 [Deltaproteobacteria bacterium]|nr:MAG: hypothetical protein EP330_19340 [Deltaproteobacteria bacterium]
MVTIDHPNRAIEWAMATNFGLVFSIPWAELREGRTYTLDDPALTAAMTWSAIGAPDPGDVYLLDGVPVNEMGVRWPLETAEFEILSIRGNPYACKDDARGGAHLKARFHLEGGNGESWAVLDGHDTFQFDDDVPFCNAGFID